MPSTNPNNLGIIVFALSGTFAMNPHPFDEQQTQIEKYIPLRELSYMPYGNDASTNISSAIESQEEKSFKNIVLEFATDLISKSENLEPEYQEIIEKRFWDLV